MESHQVLHVLSSIMAICGDMNLNHFTMIDMHTKAYIPIYRCNSIFKLCSICFGWIGVPFLNFCDLFVCFICKFNVISVDVLLQLVYGSCPDGGRCNVFTVVTPTQSQICWRDTNLFSKVAILICCFFIEGIKKAAHEPTSNNYTAI